MTKLEREKYLLALNDRQRLALLFTLSNHLKYTDSVSLEEFERMVMAYHTADGHGKNHTKEDMKKRGFKELPKHLRRWDPGDRVKGYKNRLAVAKKCFKKGRV